MLDGMDVVFARTLEQIILSILLGTKDTPGLYRTICNSADWGEFQKCVGRIQAYEHVRAEMEALVRKINNNEAADQTVN